MTHAYDKNYLHTAQKTLAGMLDYLVNDCRFSLENTWRWFLMSDLSFRFAQGDCSVLAGMSGTELAYAVLEQAGEPRPSCPPSYPYERSQEYWTGWAIAYYQWDTGLLFTEIEQAIPISQIQLLYTPYHEMDIRQFADQMNRLYHSANPDTNLKKLRSLAGLSQSSLARQADVSVRTIQQYEQRQKDINKAQAGTLLRLGKILHCTIEELLEKVPVN